MNDGWYGQPSNVKKPGKGTTEAKLCPQCGSEDIRDYPTQGHIACGECGAVLGAFIDQTSEWRTFADDAASQERSRIGGTINEFGTLASTVTKGPNGTRRDVNAHEKAVTDVKKTIERVLEVLEWPADGLKDRAGQLYFKYLNETRKQRRGYSTHVVAAACIALTRKEMGQPVPLAEVQKVLEREFGDGTRKQITTCMEKLNAVLRVNRRVVGNSYVPIFVKKLKTIQFQSRVKIKTEADAIIKANKGVAGQQKTIAAAAVSSALSRLGLIAMDGDSTEAQEAREVLGGAAGVAWETIEKARKQMRDP